MVLFVMRLAKNRIKWPEFKAYLKRPIVLSILIYLLVALLSVSWAIDREKAILVVGFTLFTALTGFLVYYWVNRKELLFKIEKVFFYAVLAVTIFGLYQFLADSLDLSTFWTGLGERYIKEILGFPRIQATALEPLFLVNFLLIPLALFSSFFLTDRGQLTKKELALALILVVANIFLAVSRGGYVASIISIILVLILLAKEYSWRDLLQYLGVLLVGFLLAISLIFLSSYISYGNQSGAESLLSHSSQLSFDEGKDLENRQEVWSWALKAFREHPIRGVGVGNFGAWMKEQGYSGRQRVVNNEPLEIVTETGILGAIPIFLILVSLMIGFIKARLKARGYLLVWLVSLFVAFLGIAVQYLTFSTLYITHFWVLIGLLLATQKIILKTDR